MGILSRFKDIMSSNVNALLDKMEDPEKMIDQMMRDISDDLGKVKAETAGVMAEEKRAKRELDECAEQVEKYQTYAEKAVLAGNDEDARKFLAKKADQTKKLEEQKRVWEFAAANSQKMQQMHDKLTEQMADLESRRDMIKSKVAAAKTQEKLNNLTSRVSSAGSSMSKFDEMEKKADRMLDQANAMAELSAATDEVDDLMKKYDDTPDQGVEDELAALKAKMGK